MNEGGSALLDTRACDFQRTLLSFCHHSVGRMAINLLLARRYLVGLVFGALAAAACTPEGQGPIASVAAVPPGDPSGAPNYVDPLRGLYNRPASSVPQDVAVRNAPAYGLELLVTRPEVAERSSAFYHQPGRSLSWIGAVVPGANYETLQNYFDARIKTSPSSSSDLDIKKTIKRVVDAIGSCQKNHYRCSIESDDIAFDVVDDMATAEKEGRRLTMVVDIRAMLGGAMGSDVAQVDVIVFVSRRNADPYNDHYVYPPVLRIVVEGHGSGFQAALGEALRQFNEKAKLYLPLGGKRS